MLPRSGLKTASLCISLNTILQPVCTGQFSTVTLQMNDVIDQSQLPEGHLKGASDQCCGHQLSVAWRRWSQDYPFLMRLRTSNQPTPWPQDDEAVDRWALKDALWCCRKTMNHLIGAKTKRSWLLIRRISAPSANKAAFFWPLFWLETHTLFSVLWEQSCQGLVKRLYCFSTLHSTALPHHDWTRSFL